MKYGELSPAKGAPPFHAVVRQHMGTGPGPQVSSPGQRLLVTFLAEQRGERVFLLRGGGRRRRAWPDCGVYLSFFLGAPEIAVMAIRAGSRALLQWARVPRHGGWRRNAQGRLVTACPRPRGGLGRLASPIAGSRYAV